MIDLIVDLILGWWKWLHSTDLYYKPYETNIIGEHKRNEKAR